VPLLALLLAAPAPTALADETVAAPAEPDVVEARESSGEQALERQRNLGAEGDDRLITEAPDEPEVGEPVSTELIFYGSGRVRLTASDGKVRISDNRSRVGMSGFKFVNPAIDIFMRVELGTDLGGDLDQLLIPGENPPVNSDATFFPRIGLLGVGTPFGELVFGKQWSTYYDVAGFTDRFTVFGAQGTAAYNAGTDGGSSGTGRADQAFVYKLRRDKLALGIQAQNDTDIPNAKGRRYADGAGFSLTYEWLPGLVAGIAYNRSRISDLDDELRALGISGDRQATIGGVQYVEENLYFGATVARHKSHATTDLGQYVDSWGTEVYARYRFAERFRAIGGINLLTPDRDDPQAGQYDIRSTILGIQYLYGDLALGDMVYFECELNGGRTFDGTRVENAYTVGIRYSFEL